MIEQAEYPGVYDRIIVVGALEMNYDPVAGTSTIDIAGYSNGGVRTDIYAPGSNIFSTTTNGPANTYDYMSGILTAQSVSVLLHAFVYESVSDTSLLVADADLLKGFCESGV